MSAIEFLDVTAAYGERAVLENFSLKIKKGEFLTVIGSSGCGKTTLLKLVNGLILPRKGTVLVNGQDILGMDLVLLRRRIGYVIQEIGLFPHMNIEKNISYVPNLYRNKDKSAISKKARKMAESVGLGADMLGRYPGELSGGQRQRVGIARALMAEPEIILMDEPFGAVDEITRKKLQDEILKIQKRLSCTIVFVTHDIKEALKLGTSVLVMDAGRAVQIGTPWELRENPRTEFVKRLVLG